ncbi:MAG: right-handed parallel beta-helix repeat-containing protein, partial [Candidatus Odinarchaeota archaeon]
MKHARKALLLLILLVIPLFLAGILHPAINNEEKAAISPIPTKVNVPSYVEQAPILAYNDTDMDNWASALLWDGNGSPDTPYIIDGYNITSDGTCIEIRDTVRAFEIRNCYISSISGSSGTGIHIDNVTQAAIVDTVIQNKQNSMELRDTSAPYIENCTIHDNYLIALFNCTGATITECDIHDNTNDGIYFNQCNDSLISYNVITNSTTGEGIFVEESYYVTITGNHISHCGV